MYTFDSRSRVTMFDIMFDTLCKAQEKVFTKQVTEIVDAHSEEGYPIYYKGQYFWSSAPLSLFLYPSLRPMEQYIEKLDKIQQNKNAWEDKKSHVASYLRNALTLCTNYTDVFKIISPQLTKMLPQGHQKVRNIDPPSISKKDIEEFQKDNDEIITYIHERIMMNLLQGRV